MARAEYDFSASSEEEISLRAGDMLNLAPKGESSLFSKWFTQLRMLGHSYDDRITMIEDFVHISHS